ncbi:MAG: four helix bundle protein [Candidatus Levybacteria bacterium]|nr:four helix bundle protein [Candidatus Levybacteria bacterium]
MSNTHDIHERIYRFVIRVLKLVKQLPKTPENFIIINQITRSATSMGANDREADGATTKKDFIHKYSIVRKEGKETDYWLHIIADTNPSFMPRMDNLINEGVEIIKIVTTIIYNTQKNKPINK